MHFSLVHLAFCVILHLELVSLEFFKTSFGKKKKKTFIFLPTIDGGNSSRTGVGLLWTRERAHAFS